MGKKKVEGLDPSEPRKVKPTKVRRSRKGFKWEHVDRVGDWEPVISDETTVLTKKEKANGDTKLTRGDREAARELERELGREATRAERIARREARRAEREAKDGTDVKPA